MELVPETAGRGRAGVTGFVFAEFVPAHPRDMEILDRTKRGTDSRNRIRRTPLHRTLEDLLPGRFRLLPSRPLQKPESCRSSFRCIGSTNAPRDGQPRSPARTWSLARTVPERPRRCPMMVRIEIRPAIRSSVSPINPGPWPSKGSPFLGFACGPTGFRSYHHLGGDQHATKRTQRMAAADISAARAAEAGIRFETNRP